MSILSDIRSDYRRFRASDDSLFATLLGQGLWASTIYRIFNAVYRNMHVPVLRKVLLLIGNLLTKAIECLTGISIPISCTIGRGLYIGHFGNIFFASRCVLGKNCNIAQGVTIETAGFGADRSGPTIGDRVYVGTNAILIGKISIGDDAAICAGAVVTTSVPPRAVVMGNPARVVSYRGSFEYVSYDDMESDPERITAKLLAEQAGWGPKPLAPAMPGDLTSKLPVAAAE